MLQLYSEVEFSPSKVSEEEISTQVMIPSDKFLQVTSTYIIALSLYNQLNEKTEEV